MTRTRSALFVLVALVLAAAAGWFYYGAEWFAPKKSKPPAPTIPAVVASASVMDVPVELELTGRTEAFETVTVKPRVDGQIRTVSFSEGQQVRQGEVLIQLDPADLHARRQQALANKAKSDALLQKARADVERTVSLRGKGFVSEERLNEVRTAAAAAESTASADAAAAELARLQLSYATITAPTSGKVGAKLVFPGTTVKSNDTALVVINRVRPLYVAFSVPEKYLPAIKTTQSDKTKTLSAEISLPGGEVVASAPVSFIDNAVDASTGNILLKTQLPNEKETLTSGQFVTVKLVLRRIKDAVVVPAEAIQQGAAGSFVFLVKPDDSVEIRPVTIGLVQKTQAVIAQGLSNGDVVVIEGQLRLTAGARIKRVELSKNPG